MLSAPFTEVSSLQSWERVLVILRPLVCGTLLPQEEHLALSLHLMSLSWLDIWSQAHPFLAVCSERDPSTSWRLGFPMWCSKCS